MAPSAVASSTTRDSSAMPAARSTVRGIVSCPFLPIFASSMGIDMQKGHYAGFPETRQAGISAQRLANLLEHRGGDASLLGREHRKTLPLDDPRLAHRVEDGA